MTDELKQIEQILGIQFEEYHYKKNQPNMVEFYGDRIRMLVIADCVFDLEVLKPLAHELYELRLTNCTISSFAGLSVLPRLNEIRFDNVNVAKGEKARPPLYEITPSQDSPLHISLRNMDLLFPAELLAAKGRLDHLFLTNCTVSNFYEINLLPDLYDLRLTNVTIRQSEDDIVHKARPDRNFIRICLDEMNLENLDVFIPVSENVSHIRIEYSTVNSLRNIHRFQMLDLLEIDSETQIQDTAFVNEPAMDFAIKNCIVGRVDRYKFVPEETFSFDLQKLGSVAHYLLHINFQGSVVHNTSCLHHFSRLETLEFDKGTVHLSDFLPVAEQIKTLLFEECKVEQHEHLREFTRLEIIRTKSYQEPKILGDLKVLLPLKHQLKELDLSEENMQNLELIKEFTALENFDCSIPTAEVALSILQLASLKKLSWSLHLETAPDEPLVVDVSGLRSMQHLELRSGDVTIVGIESLTELEYLELHCPCSIEQLHRLKKLRHLDLDTSEGYDVSKISTMESLRSMILNVEEEHEIRTLEQFPNLEQLKIEGTGKVRLGKLENLKVLIAHNLDLAPTTWFDHLPNLEKLSLRSGNISVVQNLDKLSRLKVLDLSENEIERIDGLANLKNLEHLNLYENKISDFRILNQLPNLKLANLAGNKTEDEEARAQLTKPEIACFLYVPYIPFSIRIEA